MKQILFVLIAGLLAMLTACDRRNAGPDPTSEAVDGFETTGLSELWNISKLESRAVVMQTDNVRSGKLAAMITIHEGDQSGEGGEGGRGTERDELLEHKNLWSEEGQGHSYGFSLFIPKDFPIVDTRLVLAQWKQFCPSDDCAPDNPLVALRFENGELFVTLQRGERREKVWRSMGDMAGKWLDLVFQIRFARDESGFLRVSLNNEQIVDYNGRTAYSGGGYEPQSKYYFKMGLYRDRMKEPMTIFIDEYWKRPLRTEEVEPASPAVK